MTTAPRHRLAHSIASSAPAKSVQQTLARRLLLHPHSNGDLPPLLTSQNVPPELTAELYDFIALALRAYVNPWWTKITRYDKELLPHISNIILRIVAVLEERIQAVHLAPLAFHDLPTIVTQHYVDFRNSQSKLSTSYATGGASSLSQMFCQIQPHMAISSEGNVDPEYYRQVVDQILKLCLPPEDYEPEVERIIIREVLVKVVINDIIPKVTQPWFIQKTILDLIGSSDQELYTSNTAAQPSAHESSFFHNMLVIILSALQSFSGACLALMHAYKQAISTIKLVNQSPSHSTDGKPPLPSSLAQPLSSLDFKSPPSLANSRSASTTSTASSVPTASDATSSSSLFHPQQPQDYASPPLRMVSEIIGARDRFASTLLFTTSSMISSSMTPFLDKLLPHLLLRFLSPAFILHITRLSKRTLFPNGYPGPPPIIPSPEEQAEIRASLVAWRGKGAFSHLLPALLGPDPSATLDAAIDPLCDEQCNVRLFVFILDRILVALFPELVA